MTTQTVMCRIAETGEIRPIRQYNRIISYENGHFEREARTAWLFGSLDVLPHREEYNDPDLFDFHMYEYEDREPVYEISKENLEKYENWIGLLEEYEENFLIDKIEEYGDFEKAKEELERLEFGSYLRFEDIIENLNR